MDNSVFWFDFESDEIVEATDSVLRSIMNIQETRNLDLLRYASLYRDKEIMGFNPGEWQQALTETAFADRVSLNVIKMCVDTAVSKLSMHKPMPRFITEGGSYESMEKSRLMEKLSFGVMMACDIYRLAAEVLRDAAVYGIGFLRVLCEEGKVVVRRLHPSRVVIDDQCCLDGEPTVAFIRMVVPREQLLVDFPDEEQTIMDATLQTVGQAGGQAMIEFVEAWHLGAKGRHIAYIESSTASSLGGRGLLVDEEWEGDLPLAVIRWQSDLMGWWGIGLGEILQGIQMEINETCRKIQLNHQLMSTPYLLVPIGADIPDEIFGDNSDGKIIKYSGTEKPEMVTPPAVHPQTYEHLDRLFAKAFEIAGISQLSATQQKPQGLNSGIALRTYLDVESQRFATISRQWEDLFVQLAKLIVREASRIPGFKVALADGGKLEKISIADARMAEEEYEIQVWPASALPQTPAGRLDRVVEMMQAELIDKPEAKELLDMPDLQKLNRLANASYEDFQKTFEHMLRSGEYIEPLSEFMDEETAMMGMKMCRSYWTRARIDGMEQERSDLLVRWMSEMADAMAPQEPEVPLMPPMPDGGDMGGEAPGMPSLPPPQPMTPPGMPGIPQ